MFNFIGNQGKKIDNQIKKKTEDCIIRLYKLAIKSYKFQISKKK